MIRFSSWLRSRRCLTPEVATGFAERVAGRPRVPESPRLFPCGRRPPPTVTACICGPVRAHFVSDVTDPSKHRYCLSFKGSITFKMTDGKTTSTLPHVAPSSGVPRPFVRAGLPAGASGGLLGTWHSSSSACVSGKANWELYFETYFAGPGIPH